MTRLVVRQAQKATMSSGPPLSRAWTLVLANTCTRLPVAHQWAPVVLVATVSMEECPLLVTVAQQATATTLF